MRIIFYLLAVVVIGCDLPNKTIHPQKPIERVSVNSVYIKKNSISTDSIQLSAAEAQSFVEKWNAAGSKGPTKMLPEFWLSVHLKNGEVRKFRANRDVVKEDSDWAYSISDTTLFDAFWKRTRPKPKPEE